MNGNSTITNSQILSSFSGRFKGDKGENGKQGERGAEAVNGPANVKINEQTDDYTLVLADTNVSLILMNKATAVNVTVPPNSDVPFPIGGQALVDQDGIGQVTFVAGAGVTIKSADSNLSLRVQNSGATLVKVAENIWKLYGDLA